MITPLTTSITFCLYLRTTWPTAQISVTSFSIDQFSTAPSCCYAEENSQTTVFRRQNSRFRKWFLEIGLRSMLQSLIRILRASLVQINTEMAEKYSNQCYAVNWHGRYAISTKYSLRIAISAYPTCIWRPHKGVGVPIGIAPPRLVRKKLEWIGYPMVKKFWRYVYSFWQNWRTWTTDRRTDTACRHILRLCIASHGKNWTATIIITQLHQFTKFTEYFWHFIQFSTDHNEII